MELLIHVGLDTVELGGEGFKSLVKSDDQVRKGDLLLEFDMEFIKSQGKSLISPVIITNKKGLDTTHIGLASWHADGLHLLNASSIHHRVIDEPMLLRTYMSKHPVQTGIRVCRVTERQNSINIQLNHNKCRKIISK